VGGGKKIVTDVARAGEGRAEAVDQPIATVVVSSGVYHEYLHLVRTRDGWKIANALWVYS
jgi:hypothetical protein